MKKTLSMFLALCMIVTILPLSAMAEEIYGSMEITALGEIGGTTIDMNDTDPPSSGAKWTYAGNVYTIEDGAEVIVTGTNADNRRIEVEENATATITLNNVSITNLGANQSPLLLKAAQMWSLSWQAVQPTP